jgi:hypothetical protein
MQHILLHVRSCLCILTYYSTIIVSAHVSAVLSSLIVKTITGSTFAVAQQHINFVAVILD